MVSITGLDVSGIRPVRARAPLPRIAGAAMVYSAIGAWRSPVAHRYGVPVVGGSNPLAPTNRD